MIYGLQDITQNKWSNITRFTGKKKFTKLLITNAITRLAQNRTDWKLSVAYALEGVYRLKSSKSKDTGNLNARWQQCMRVCALYCQLTSWLPAVNVCLQNNLLITSTPCFTLWFKLLTDCKNGHLLVFQTVYTGIKS